MKAFIHGWTLHFTGIVISSRAHVSISGLEPAGCDLFQSRFCVGSGWMVWVVWSLFLIWICCPAITASTCGWYVQPSWSSSAGVEGGGKLPAGGVFRKTMA